MSFKHLEGCSPLYPCENCEFAALLRKELSAKDYATLSSDPRLVDLLNKRIELLEIPIRARHALNAANIYSIRDLLQKTEKELERVEGLGRRAIHELKDVLAIQTLLPERALVLGMNV